MDSGEFSHEEKAEIMRKQSRYRELILSGRLDLPYKRAAQLLGPDCLYHLYSLDLHQGKKARSKRVVSFRPRPRRI